MRYRIDGIRLSADEYRDADRRSGYIEKKIRKKIGNKADIRDITIVRESIDARKKPDVRAVFALSFTSDRDLPLEAFEPDELDMASRLPAYDNKRPRPVIAGFGPCGIFAALTLALAGARPLVVERGKPVEERVRDVERFWNEGILDVESNVQFGEGGAGTFSDGKLTTGLKDGRLGWILRQFVEAGADPEILYRSKPHIGTDKLRQIIPRMRKKILDLGAEIRFSTRLESVIHEDGRLKGVVLSGSDPEPGGSNTEEGERRTYTMDTEDLILATGHSAEDTMRMLLDEGVSMRPKPFSIGVRIEHLQSHINRVQYGDEALAEVFGPAEYKLNHRCENGRGVYTFCMCPGGRVINGASTYEQALTNGMSDHSRDGRFANSGLLVDVRTEDYYDGNDPLAGIAFQRKYERKAWERGLPSTTYENFREDDKDPVRECLPGFAVESILEAMPHLGRKLEGFDDDEAVMTGVETRSSSPVRISRDDDLQSSIDGMIPAGEGPGYAGGIMSSAVDGIRAAEAVLNRNKL